MESSERRYRANDEECAAKVIDGEAMIINLLNGTYYSLDKTGGAIWELVADGLTMPEIVSSITERYAVDDDRARADAERLIAELLSERLLVPLNGSAPAPRAPAVSTNDASRLAYEAPSLTTYKDMADLLALDPPMPQLGDIVWTDPGAGGARPA
ncbi:MAG: PqqD family protein [Gemmatimonadota bacterium]|nr:PqqD family protein [Gemmatimonadota bacterium]